MNKSQFKYWPFYCEENIWHLIQEPYFQDKVAEVVLISNLDRQCLFLKQKAGKGNYVLWDYHVILATPGYIWDLDTLLPFPCNAQSYLLSTFGSPSESPFQPIFKLVDAKSYIQQFSSDRSHMLDEEGNYLQPPPPWPPINEHLTPNLQQFIDMTCEKIPATICNLQEMLSSSFIRKSNEIDN